ncbi:Hypothetical predicted protein [Prunus dulcis]|uniref:Transcriptional regulator SLK2 n=1 Tax=Prunus dulcis TaxID=3755 RepID=A0A5E4FRV6_PRUDU|nr:probable transcriptional regulator SLK2 [Prunus dulcis]XP_034215298.1 probable transcriptional regulator SLK2 [Prunus dulcis]XP_034215299.1 probable transcriptional regulator SLK2 [Prunus dulcis]VVA30164.1 Hypothetical predicted protein [Prunus dulcis]
MPPKRKQYQWHFGAAPQPALKNHHPLLNGGEQEPLTSSQRHKKPRIDVKKEASLNKHAIQQLLQSQDSEELQRNKLQIQELFHYNMSQNQDQQKILHPSLQLKGVDKEKQQQLMRHVVTQQEVVHQASVMQLPDEGVCSRRLMQYIYHLRNRPADNNLSYWRKFVAEYYAPSAKKRWCLSSYDEVGRDALGILPHLTMVPWQCNICGCKSRRGFEAYFEVLPRLNEITFGSGVIDELLFLDLPREIRFPSGVMMLEYGRAVQESVYQQLQVVHEGQLRIVFSRDLKILSWEFCVCSHEVFFRRTAVAPQVVQLVHAVQDYKCSIDDRGSDGVLFQDVQANCNRILAAGGQLAKTVDQQLVDDLGFSKRYTRCLQISEIVYAMKDLMILCQDNVTGPIESLESYCRGAAMTKLQKQEIKGKEQLESARDPPKDNNKLMAASCGFRSNTNESSPMSHKGLSTSAELAASLLRGSHHKLMGQSNLTSIVSRASQEPHIQDTSSEPFQGPRTSNSGLIKSSVENGLSSLDSSMKQYAIQKLVQEMINNNSRSANKHDREEPIWGSGKGSVIELPSGVWGCPTAAAAQGNVFNSIAGRTSSSKAAFNGNSSKVHTNNCFINGEPNLSGKLYLPESIVNISHGYHDHNSIYGNGNDVGYGWKV